MAAGGLPLLSTTEPWLPTDETDPLFLPGAPPVLDFSFPHFTQNPIQTPFSGQPSQLSATTGPIKSVDRCEKAEVKILNPKRFYDKKQRKHGTGGKVSEQRINDDQVQIGLFTVLPLIDVQVYVQREPEIARKLAAKNPQLYDVGPVLLPTTGFEPLHCNLDVMDIIDEIVNGGFNYRCSVELDSVYKTPDGKEIYHLEKARGLVNNRFQLLTCLQFEDGSHVTLAPYEFILKSGRTPKPSGGERKDSEASSSQTYSLSPGSPRSVPSPSDSSEQCNTVFCRHLKAEVAKIRSLEVEEITTTGHDIAYYLKVRPNLLKKFEEGDVVGFFESDAGDTYIDFLTAENSTRARMAGVISRSAYVKGKAGAHDDNVDLVCIIGEICVKVVGRVHYGDLIYTSKCDEYPGTASRETNGSYNSTLLGYAMESSREEGVKRISCLVSIVMGICAKNQRRNMDQLKARVRSLEQDLVDIEDTLGSVGVDVVRMQKCWKGCKMKALIVSAFLALATVTCCLFLAPNSPYLKYMCSKGSIKEHCLTFEYTPTESDDNPETIKGIEFEWSTVQKKLNLGFRKKNGTNVRYFLNYNRCVTGGMRRVASWLDPAPSVPKVNVLAVERNCSTVYYHSKAHNEWRPYEKEQVKNIKCEPRTVDKS